MAGTRLKANLQPPINIILYNHNLESTPTESEKRGILLFISSDLNLKVWNDLKVCRVNKLESHFIEILNKSKLNCIVDRVYKHPKMSTYEFNNMLTQILREKFSWKQKRISNEKL